METVFEKKPVAVRAEECKFLLGWGECILGVRAQQP